MPAYVIVQGSITDPEQFDAYRAQSGPSVAAAGGRYIVRGGGTVALEGAAPPERTTVLEFESVEAATAWYHGAAYIAARELRAGAADFDMYIVEGVG